MADLDEAKRLLGAAEKDFRALGGMTDAAVFCDEVFGFHAQQAVEKVLKAWLAFLDEEYPKTHDISFLAARLEARGEPAGSLAGFVDLNPYAVQFRYQAFDEVGEPIDRNEVRGHSPSEGAHAGRHALVEKTIKFFLHRG